MNSVLFMRLIASLVLVGLVAQVTHGRGDCLPRPSNNFPPQSSGRPAPNVRRFKSAIVDNAIETFTAKMKDADLAKMFSQTLPNTLDTTVWYCADDGSDAFIITGDIPASWLRDSMNQVLPYLRYASGDTQLQTLFRGVIARQVHSVLIDAYANAFTPDNCGAESQHLDDSTSAPSYLGARVNAMNERIFERKYELDSLCAVLKLSRRYYEATGDMTPFTSEWVQAVDTIITTMRTEQRDTAEEDAHGGPVYRFQRSTQQPTDTLSHGRGFPSRHTGMIKSAFRGSDDACIYAFLVPSNAMAVVELRAIAPLLRKLTQSALAQEAETLAAEVDAAIRAHAILTHPTAGTIYAYEVDGFGNAVFMDDANIPSLLSFPYLGYLNANDSVYQATRRFLLSPSNPWFFHGSAGSGIGGPHNGVPYVWPMAIAMRAFTAQSDQEIMDCLENLKNSTAGTYFMHESFNRDNANDYTRPWFAWANSLFGDLLLTLGDTHPHLIFK